MLVIPSRLLRCWFMNILIENADSLEYFTETGTWTKNVDNGKRFVNTALAYDVAKKELIQKFNIVSYITQTKQFVNLDHGRGKGATETTESSPA